MNHVENGKWRKLGAKLGVWVGSAASLGGILGCGAAPDDTTSVDTASEPLVNGTYSWARPEIGQIALNGGLCTATLVDPRFVLTADHCIKYTTGNATGTFTTTSTSGTVRNSYSIDKTFALGPGDPNNPTSGLGDQDVALVRLATSVPSTVASPTYVAPWPVSGTTQTAWGYGCQSRTTQAGGGAKQYFVFQYGQRTQSLCPGDSGGPVVWNGPFQGGGVFAVNSGYDGSGYDIFGNASNYAPPGLTAVRALSNTTVVNTPTSSFPQMASTSGVTTVSGDFNGDHFTDLAITGGPWQTISVAFNGGTGTFTRQTSFVQSSFSGWAQQSGVQAVTGDFNADSRTDIALVGGPKWTTIPVAFSNGDGTFRVTNLFVDSFPGWADGHAAQAIAGDFNADGRADIALVGGVGWSTVPVAFSNGDGTFLVSNKASAQFATWASDWMAQAASGDFDGDGDADIGLARGSGWKTIPVAFSDRTGGFTITNQTVDHFPEWAQGGTEFPLPTLLSGEFNGDGRADLVLVGGGGWVTVGFAFSTGGGNFQPANLPVANFPGWATQARFLLPGRFDGDARSDIAILGGSGWTTIPEAFFRP